MTGQTNVRVVENLRMFARGSGVGAAAFGVVVLLGWSLEAALLKGGLLFPGHRVDPTTGLGLVFGGLALFLLQPQSGGRPAIRWRLLAGESAATLVALIGFARLFGAIAEDPVPLVERLFADQPDAGPMAPTMAFHFFLLGAALLLIDWQLRRDRPSQFLVITPLFVAIVSILLYAYGQDVGGAGGSKVPMLLPMAVAFFALCLGVLFTYPDRGMMTLVTRQDPGSTLARLLLPAALAIPALLGLLRTVAQRAQIYDEESSLPVLYVSTIIVFAALVGVTATFLNRSEVVKRAIEGRLATQFATVKLLAESGTVDATLAGVLGAVGEAQGWAAGIRWDVDDSLRLVKADSWSRPTPAEPKHKASTAPEAERAGLAARAVASRHAQWASAPREKGARALLPSRAALGRAVAFPIRGTTSLRGVMEFWGSNEEAEDPQTLEMYEAIGRQIGQFIERKEAQAEVERARLAAEAATQAKSIFLANMSHEIRTPMNAIIGMTQLMQDAPMDAQQREFLDTIRVSGETLLYLINDLLDFSKIESGKLEIEKQPFPLNEVVEAALSIIGPKGLEKGLEIAYVIRDSAPKGLRSDAARLRQVLLNLLSNAVKFTEKGSVTLTVAGKPVAADSVEVQFDVADTGIGIPADRMDRLFQAFTQVDSSTTRLYGGTGLGLAISKRLVELMGGRVWIDSQPGRGSTFHFTVVCPAAPEAVRGLWDQPVAALKGRSVLVATASPINRELLQLRAGRWGLVVKDAPGGHAALEALAAGPAPDVVVIDNRLPDMKAFELARAIRETPAWRRLPLILLASTRAEREEAAASGGQPHALLQKPLRVSQILDAFIESVAGAPPQPRSAPVAAPATAGPPKTGTLRILLAEDNAVNRKVAKFMLQRLGESCDAVENGALAVEAVAARTYDLVFMDVQMPDMDGLEATRRICARWPKGARPRIVAMTAGALAGDREKCIEAGMDDYIAKPIRLEDLEAQLQATPRRSESPSKKEATQHA
ncbi:MAG: response regulator [Euryarchaeota archaeon]|nr:response regulator [Euryarchaeota archaeon]